MTRDSKAGTKEKHLWRELYPNGDDIYCSSDPGSEDTIPFLTNKSREVRLQLKQGAYSDSSEQHKELTQMKTSKMENILIQKGIIFGTNPYDPEMIDSKVYRSDIRQGVVLHCINLTSDLMNLDDYIDSIHNRTRH